MPIKVTHRKLGKHKADGLAWVEEKHIEVDTTLTGRKRLEIMIHELLHVLNPEWSESKVIKQSKRISSVLWRERYRRLEQ